MTLRRAAGVLAAAFLAAGCGGGQALDPGRVCTTEFRMLTIRVTEPGGAPAAGVVISDSLPRTGRVITPVQPGFMAPGEYLVLDDGHLPLLRQSGDTVLVRGVRGGARFTEAWVVDVPGGCHVNRVSGAAVAVLR